MRLPIRRALAAAVSSARLRRGLSTAASRPQWAIVDGLRAFKSTSPLATFELAEPPCFSHLLLPSGHVNPLPRIDSDLSSLGIFGGMVCATSGDGLLLLKFMDEPATPAVAARVRAAWKSGSIRLSVDEGDVDPDITRFVCNPMSGEVFRLPDIDGMKKMTRTWDPEAEGILTQSACGHESPDRYAVAGLGVDGEGDERTFVMRRFFSRTGEWDKLVGLPSPLPRPRRINIDLEVLAFAGRLWWVDLTWGTVSADPFSDRPELRFVELPRASVWAVPGPRKDRAQVMYRRMGVSEGRMRYIEVSQKLPFVLSSYTLDDDGDGWTLEHQVALIRLLPDAGTPEGTPRIGVIHPLNAHVMNVIYGKHVLAIDMDMGKVLASWLITDVSRATVLDSLKACVLPPWLGTTRIPSAGKMKGAGNKTLADILVRSCRE